MLTTGTLVAGKYKILELLGRGGTSCVFLAKDIHLDRLLAVKEIYKQGSTGVADEGGKLIAEATILKGLRHQGLPVIEDILETYQSYLVIMEYIHGISLAEVVEQRGAQLESDVRKWGGQLCDVLHYLHQKTPAIIYRDMKPSNIMLKPNGDVVLIDFGMAREYKADRNHDTFYWGTHGYAAPEQYDENCQSDARTDIYGLGMTMYHLVTGKNPCTFGYGTDPMKELEGIVSESFAEILYKCTNLRPEDRIQTAALLKKKLTGQVVIVGEYDDEDTEVSKGNGAIIGLAIGIPLALVAIVLALFFAFGMRPLPSLDGMPSAEYVEENDTAENIITENEESMEEVAEKKTRVWDAQVNITEPQNLVRCNFTAPRAGNYSIYASHESAFPVVWVSDTVGNEVTQDNVYGENNSFFVTVWMEEGEMYYIDTTLYYLDENKVSTGSYQVFIELEE